MNSNFKMSVSIKLKPGKLLSGPVILTAYTKGSFDHALSRMAKHRRVEDFMAISRPCDQEEFGANTHPYRAGFSDAYYSWDKFIEDEKRFCDDPEWMAKIEELRKKYPQLEK